MGRPLPSSQTCSEGSRQSYCAPSFSVKTRSRQKLSCVSSPSSHWSKKGRSFEGWTSGPVAFLGCPVHISDFLQVPGDSVRAIFLQWSCWVAASKPQQLAVELKHQLVGGHRPSAGRAQVTPRYSSDRVSISAATQLGGEYQSWIEAWQSVRIAHPERYRYSLSNSPAYKRHSVPLIASV